MGRVLGFGRGLAISPGLWWGGCAPVFLQNLEFLCQGNGRSRGTSAFSIAAGRQRQGAAHGCLSDSPGPGMRCASAGGKGGGYTRE